MSGKAILNRRQDVVTKSPHMEPLVTSNTNSIGTEVSTINSVGMEAGIVDESLKCCEYDSDITPPVRKRLPGDVKHTTPKRLKFDSVISRTSSPPPPNHPLNIASKKSYLHQISEGRANSSVSFTSLQQPDSHISPPNTYSDNSSLQHLFPTQHPPPSATVHSTQPQSTSSQSLSSVLVPAIASLPDSKSSPTVFCSSTESNEVDNLFDSIVCNSDNWMVDDAIFGGGKSTELSQVGPVHDDKSTMDGATIQVLLAKDEMEQEKFQLLSSIKALQSELVAKNDMIAKKEEDEREKQDKGKVVSSMKEEFTCVICQDLFINAHTLPCAHSFCELCIKEWIKGSKGGKNCPICRKYITSDSVRSIVLDNAISMLEVELSEEEKQERARSKEYHKTCLSSTTRTSKAKAKVPLHHPSISGRTGSQSSSNFGIVIGNPSQVEDSANPIQLDSDDDNSDSLDSDDDDSDSLDSDDDDSDSEDDDDSDSLDSGDDDSDSDDDTDSDSDSEEG